MAMFSEMGAEVVKRKSTHKKNVWYQQTESLLYNYKSFRIRIMALMQQLEVVREQLLPSMVPDYRLKEGKVYNVSSPVETAVLNRIEGDTVQKLERKIKNLESLQEIVELSIDTMLNQEQRKLVDLIYNKQQPWQQTCNILSIDKNTYYKKKNEVVKILGWCFGYLQDEDAEEVLGLFTDIDLWKESRKD